MKYIITLSDVGRDIDDIIKEQKNELVVSVNEFDDIWPYYPKRAGNNPKPKALKAYEKRRKSFSFEVIQRGVIRYQAFCEATGKLNTEFVMQAARFFGPDECFTQDWDIPISTQRPTLHQQLNDTSWADDIDWEEEPRY